VKQIFLSLTDPKHSQKSRHPYPNSYPSKTSSEYTSSISKGALHKLNQMVNWAFVQPALRYCQQSKNRRNLYCFPVQDPDRSWKWISRGLSTRKIWWKWLYRSFLSYRAYAKGKRTASRAEVSTVWCYINSITTTTTTTTTTNKKLSWCWQQARRV